MVFRIIFVNFVVSGFSKSISHVYRECMTDRKDIEKLFRQYYRRMYRLATILLHDDAESKDVVHDVFAQLLSDTRSLREDTAESFLLTCVRNRCLNVMRNRQIQERIGRLYLLDLETSILSEPQLREEMESLNEGISHLQAFFSFPPSQPVPLSHFFLGSFLLISFIINRLPSNLLQHPLLQFFPDSFAQFRNSE